MILLIVLLVLIILYFILLYVAYAKVFGSKRIKFKDIVPEGEQYKVFKDEIIELHKSLSSLDYEDIWINSQDGLKLHGKYYPSKSHKAVDICFHGYRSSSVRDFCGGINLMLKLDHDIILIDERAHGESQGRTITLGAKEKYDCLSWIKYSSSRFGTDTPIFLYGVSMGASVLLMASDLDLPDNVKGIIADSPYSSAKEIIFKVISEKHVPRRLTEHLVSVSSRWLGKFDMDDADAVKAVKSTTVPILVIHGDADRFVPCKMSEYIKKSNIDKVDLYIFHGAGHGISYLVDTERYCRIVNSFIDRCINI